MRLGRVLYTCGILTLIGVGGVTSEAIIRVPFACSAVPLIKSIVKKFITSSKAQ